MGKILGKWILGALALFLVSKIIPGIVIDNFWAALVAMLVIGLVNAVIKPILFILTLPLTILTLGLFTFVLNALMLLLAGSVTNGFHVSGFWTALVGSILFSIISTILQSLVK